MTTTSISMSMQVSSDRDEANHDWASDRGKVKQTVRQDNCLDDPFFHHRAGLDMNAKINDHNNVEMQAAAVLASLQRHHQPLPTNSIHLPSLQSPAASATATKLAFKNPIKPWLRTRNISEHSEMTETFSSSSPSCVVSWCNSNTSTNTTATIINDANLIKLCDNSIALTLSNGSEEHAMATHPNTDVATASPTTLLLSTSMTWYSGAVSLAMDEDEDILSPLHCFMRKYCVEAFSATPKDITTPRYGKAHGGRIVVGQVGIRCLHCRHQPNKAERAVCYPSSLRNIYHSMETWQRRHSWVCPDIPKWIRQEMIKFMTCSRSGAGGRRQYWEDSARKLGMANTEHGVRFCRPPGVLMDGVGDMEQRDATSSTVSRGSSRNAPLSSLSLSSSPPHSPSAGNTSTHRQSPIVFPQDKHLVTEYLFQLMDQMEVCSFSEEDRIGGRSKVKTCPIGFPGMQCKHCMGKAGFGRYFPASLQALALANSDRNIHNHLIKCRKCPQEIQDKLQRLSQVATSTSNNNRNQGSLLKNKRGSRKAFFEQIWNRMHNNRIIDVQSNHYLNEDDDHYSVREN